MRPPFSAGFVNFIAKNNNEVVSIVEENCPQTILVLFEKVESPKNILHFMKVFEKDPPIISTFISLPSVRPVPRSFWNNTKFAVLLVGN